MNAWNRNYVEAESDHLMNPFKTRRSDRRLAFTLIELLVVIAIISLLAAIIIPMAASAKVSARINRAKADRDKIETELESYKAHKGFYPPDNQASPRDLAMPPLFYELTGTLLNGGVFRRLNGGDTISQANVKQVFGVDSFLNSAKVTDFNDKNQIQDSDVRDYFPGLKPTDYLQVDYGGKQVAVLGLPIDGPNELTSTDKRKINPWRYNSSNPTNNPNSYDLWIDLVLRGKTNRISNWRAEPQIVN